MRVNDQPADFLPNPRRFVSDYDLLQQNLKKFTPFNCLIFLATQSVNVSDDLTDQEEFGTVDSVTLPPGDNSLPLPELDLEEPIYTTPFAIYSLPIQLATYYNSPDTNCDLYPANANMLVPSEAHLVTASPTNQTAPVLLSGSQGVETWVFSDTRSFDEPKMNMRCELKSGKYQESAEWFSKFFP